MRTFVTISPDKLDEGFFRGEEIFENGEDVVKNDELEKVFDLISHLNDNLMKEGFRVQIKVTNLPPLRRRDRE